MMHSLKFVRYTAYLKINKNLKLFNGSCKTDKVSHSIYLSNFFWLRLVLSFVNGKIGSPVYLQN